MEDIITQATLVSALAVTGLLQLLKLKIIPTRFANDYPVPSLIVLSAGASVIASMVDAVNPTTWTDWLVLGAVIAVSSALTYRTTLQNWSELRELESGKGV